MNQSMRVGHGAGAAGVRGAEGGAAVREKKKALIEPLPPPLTLEEIRRLSGDQVRAPKQPVFRFAPSPTGHLHIGGARTALMNYLAAQKMGGKFVLRVEDTDQLRSKPEYTEAIKKGLKWLGINWEGEIVFQSQRTRLYQEKVKKLVDEGKAYRNETGAILFRMPEEGTLVVNDRVKGRVPISVTESDGMRDFVIQRSDGSPTFLLANVVDDGDMGITHVIRGEDHLTNAARQIPLFRALGYEVPEFYHVPLIHGDDGAKLSKRHGAQSVIDYQDQGYDALVLVNHLARLGMNYGTEETLPVEDLAERFDPLAFSKSRSLLGLDKLAVRGMQYIKKADPEQIIEEIKNRTQGDTVRVHLEDGSIGEEPNLLKGLNAAQLEALADGARCRATTFMEVVEIGQFVKKPAVYSDEDAKVHGAPKLKALMKKLMGKLEEVPAAKWNLKTLDKLLEDFNEANNAKYKQYGNALRWMLTGVKDGLPLHHTMVVLGREETLRRLEERTA
jgi:glutamyl-tRNA synthetase